MVSWCGPRLLPETLGAQVTVKSTGDKWPRLSLILCIADPPRVHRESRTEMGVEFKGTVCINNLEYGKAFGIFAYGRSLGGLVGGDGEPPFETKVAKARILN